MTKPFHLAVFIGRFQPFHVGHLAVALDALSHADKLLILIGSANRSRDTRNPFTATERMHMISNAVYDAGVLDHTEIGFLDDHPYDMQRWIEGTQSVVADAAKALGMTDPKVMLTGHNRDLSSFYLKKFPQWTFNEAESGDTSINATAIRTAYFERVLHVKPALKKWMPPATSTFFDTFEKRSIYEKLCADYRREVRYREGWGPGPFQCADAVVIQSGHVLVVERGGDFGHGTLALPGGHLEVDETLDQCVVRELFEETNLFAHEPDMELRQQLVWQGFRGRERFDDPYRSCRARVITEGFMFKLPDHHALPPVRGADDAKRAFWLPLKDVDPKKMFEDHGFIINRMTRYL